MNIYTYNVGFSNCNSAINIIIHLKGTLTNTNEPINIINHPKSELIAVSSKQLVLYRGIKEGLSLIPDSPNLICRPLEEL